MAAPTVLVRAMPAIPQRVQYVPHRVGTRDIKGDRAVDLRTFPPGGAALGRRPSGPGAAVIPASPPVRSNGVGVPMTAQSMRVMEASLAAVAILTAVLLGLGR